LPVLDRLDGLLIPGSPSNVHPSHYEGGDSQTPDRHDPPRDSTTLPLIRAAIRRRGMPVLAICRHPGAERRLGGTAAPAGCTRWTAGWTNSRRPRHACGTLRAKTTPSR